MESYYKSQGAAEVTYFSFHTRKSEIRRRKTGATEQKLKGGGAIELFSENCAEGDGSIRTGTESV